MTVLRLRDYQEQCLAKVLERFREKPERLLAVLPTGAGKTVIFSALCERWRNEHSGGRWPTLVLVHRDELIHQTVEKLHMIAPALRVGVVKASRNETDADVIVGSVQTLARADRRAALPRVGLVIVDEAHHAVAESYQTIIRECGGWEGTPVLGVTATPSRGDSQGLGKVWQEIVFRRATEWMIAKGYLVDVRCLTVDVPGYDLSGVGLSGGDLAARGVENALQASNAADEVAKRYVEHASDRQGVIFTPGVPSAQWFAEAFRDNGITAEVIVGSTPTEERRAIYDRVRSGEVQVLSSAMVLTEGFDMPQLSCAVIARKTKSQGLFVQMAGRVLRPSRVTGKRDALILDVAGVAGKHKLATIADLTEKGVRPQPGETIGEAIIREAREQGELTEIKLKEISLFESSPVNWLKTRQGIRFVQTRMSTWFLLDNGDGTFRVGQCGANSTANGRYHHKSIDLEYGMSYVEQLVTDEDPSIAERDSAWRKGNRKPSEAQVEFAQRLGIATEGVNKRDLSDAISVALVSRMLDRGKRKS